jgi:hypothetical protein
MDPLRGDIEHGKGKKDDEAILILDLMCVVCTVLVWLVIDKAHSNSTRRYDARRAV